MPHEDNPCPICKDQRYIWEEPKVVAGPRVAPNIWPKFWKYPYIGKLLLIGKRVVFAIDDNSVTKESPYHVELVTRRCLTCGNVQLFDVTTLEDNARGEEFDNFASDE